MTLCDYNPAIFDNLGEIGDVAKTVDPLKLQEVGNQIISFKHEPHVLVAYAHRHFDLASDEVMLETQEGNVRIAKPIPRRMLGTLQAHPSIIACGANGKWYPFNIVTLGDDHFDKEVCNDSDFLNAIAAYLIENNLQDKLVLADRSSMDEINGDDVPIEFNDHEGRISTTMLSNKNLVEAEPSTFAFQNQGLGGCKVVQAAWCRTTHYLHF